MQCMDTKDYMKVGCQHSIYAVIESYSLEDITHTNTYTLVQDNCRGNEKCPGLFRPKFIQD